ncbi:uncharacterized protein LOC131428428 [Malaya genurostris]|uniref:uncharacterized protein LOC131428428 n=1 Tax=Malaya genurostris TaxID=325434 RepID=UPI0026F3D8AB|nr:uncharacterized protein LOC131428428 [Malaya genurostris]
MNFLASVTLLGLAAFTLAALTPEQQEEADMAIGQCATDLGFQLDGDIIVIVKYNGTLFPGDENSKEFLACALKQIDVLTDDGIQIEKYIDFLSEGHDVQALSEVINKCATVDGDTVTDKGYNFYKCFWDTKDFDL